MLWGSLFVYGMVAVVKPGGVTVAYVRSLHTPISTNLRLFPTIVRGVEIIENLGRELIIRHE